MEAHAVKLEDLLEKKYDAVARRWVEEVLATYPEDAAAIFNREQDPFANPIGASVRRGTRGLLSALLGDMDRDRIHEHLDDIIRVRAVQQISPSQALSFVFSLKPILREVLPEAAEDPRLGQELLDLESRVDRLALFAFDLYAACREEVSQLRINEAKRQVAWILEKINQRDAASDEMPASPD